MTEFDTLKILGVSCLLSVSDRWVLEIQKPNKWVYKSGHPPVIGMGCIGGAIEHGETPTQALQREAKEEIKCSINLWSAPKTIDISPS